MILLRSKMKLISSSRMILFSSKMKLFSSSRMIFLLSSRMMFLLSSISSKKKLLCSFKCSRTPTIMMGMRQMRRTNHTFQPSLLLAPRIRWFTAVRDNSLPFNVTIHSRTFWIRSRVQILLLDTSGRRQSMSHESLASLEQTCLLILYPVRHY